MNKPRRFSDIDARFKAATDAQLAEWEADQAKPVRMRKSLKSDLKELVWAIIIVTAVGVVCGSLVLGQLQGLWG